jgi:hypothetical protein
MAQPAEWELSPGEGVWVCIVFVFSCCVSKHYCIRLAYIPLVGLEKPQNILCIFILLPLISSVT